MPVDLDEQERLAHQALRRASISRHGACEKLFKSSNLPRWRFWDLDSLFINSRIGGFPVQMILLHVSNPPRGLSSAPFRTEPTAFLTPFLQRPPEVDLKGILLVRELFGYFTGTAEERKVGADRVGGVPGAAAAALLLLALE